MVQAKPGRLRCLPLLSALLVLAAPTAARAKPGDPLPVPSEASASIERLLREAIHRGFMPGVSVSIISGRGGSFIRHVGRASIEREGPVTAATRFRIGSISKLVTAAAVLKLVEEGRLRIDSPVASLLPEESAIAKLPVSVTVERLLNHTSGLPDFTKEELQAKVARGLSVDDDLRVVLAREPMASPGEQWSYADGPYRILSRIVERTSGLSYGAYVTDRLAPALGLSSLGLCEPGAPDHAEGYLSERGKLRPEPAYAIRGLLGEGGLCATSEDLAKLPLALADGRWLSRQDVARMTAPTRLTDGTVVDYGLGVRGGWLGDHKSWGHTGGGLHGSWAAVAYYPTAGISVAVVANGTGGDIDAATLQGRVAAIVLGVKPPRTAQPGAGLMGAVAGVYKRGEQITCLSSIGGDLVRTRPGTTSPPTPLYPQAKTVFARLDFPLDRFVFQLQDGTAVAYRVYYDGLFAEHWRRVPGEACGQGAQKP